MFVLSTLTIDTFFESRGVMVLELVVVGAYLDIFTVRTDVYIVICLSHNIVGFSF